MVPEKLEVAVDGGVADALLFRPSGVARAPVVVMYFDAGGLRPAMSRMAEPLLSAGYAVLQPNLYWRSGPFAPFDMATVFTVEAERARIFALMNGFTPEQAMSDTAALLGALDGEGGLSTRRVGALGYCMGGRMAFFAAGSLADRVVAMASVHGGGLVTPAANSPHNAASRMRAELYFACADNDSSCRPEHREALAATFAANGVTAEIELFAGKKHGFAMSDFPVFDAGASATQWTKVLALFARNLI